MILRNLGNRIAEAAATPNLYIAIVETEANQNLGIIAANAANQGPQIEIAAQNPGIQSRYRVSWVKIIPLREQITQPIKEQALIAFQVGKK